MRVIAVGVLLVALILTVSCTEGAQTEAPDPVPTEPASSQVGESVSESVESPQPAEPPTPPVNAVQNPAVGPPATVESDLEVAATPGAPIPAPNTSPQEQTRTQIPVADYSSRQEQAKGSDIENSSLQEQTGAPDADNFSLQEQKKEPDTDNSSPQEQASPPHSDPDLQFTYEVLGYWSDGTASVGITASLTNWDGLGLDKPLLGSVACRQEGNPVGECRNEIAFAPHPDSAGVEQAFTVRVPAGQSWLALDYGGTEPSVFQLDVPPRITGISRRVWECFSDTSTSDTVFEELRGVGCAGWEKDTIQKRDPSSPVKVYVQGPGGFTEEFKQVLAYLSPVMNLRFEQVDARYDSHVVAYIGASNVPEDAGEAICFTREDFGCAEHVSIDGEAKDRIVVFNRWPELGSDLGDFDQAHRARFRSSMIYAIVHSLSGMNRRADEFSLMNEAVDHRTELNPMDDALLRLHGHELVEPGMTFEDVGQLVIFNDELLDSPTEPSQLLAWSLVKNVLEKLRQETTIRFLVRAHSPGCPGSYGWGEYTGGNLTGLHPYMGWVSLNDGANHLYSLQPDTDASEFWHRKSTGWAEVSRGQYAETASGWQGQLSDPHFLLHVILHNARWSEVSISSKADGNFSIQLRLNSIAGPVPMEGAQLQALLLIGPGAQALREYRVRWQIEDRACGTYQVEATEGVMGVEFVFPDEVQRKSRFLDSCVDTLSVTLTDYFSTEGEWARECGPGMAGEGYARKVSFTLDQWAFVRYELFSHDDIRMELYRRNGLELEAVSPEASDYLIGGYGLKEWEGRLRWAHVPLGPGDYTLEAISLNRESLGEFTLTMFAQPAPPPPYRFKAVTTGINISCGILVEGAPMCWGGDSRYQGFGAVPPAGEFLTISAGGFVCAIRNSGAAECWDSFWNARTPPAGETFEAVSVGWVHACALRSDSTPVCWGTNQGGKASPPADERFVQVSSGTSHSCGVRSSGAALCWGASQEEPWEVPGGPFVSISVGEEYDCALRRDGEVLCQGENGFTICETHAGGWKSCLTSAWADGVPQSPPDGERFTSFSTSDPNCALRQDGSPVCWSEDLSGPFPEPPGERFTTVSATSNHACGLREDGTAVCWGYNRFGESSPPSGIHAEGQDERSLPTGLTDISSGGIQTCALDGEGQAVCWGPNWWRGRFTGQFTAISSGGNHACALLAEGTAECRGANSDGQSSAPEGEFTAISAGGAHTCGLRPEGTAVCWGSEFNGASTPPPGEVFQFISSGLLHTCGLRPDGTLACWGGLWDGSVLLDVALPPDGVFTTISSGAWHACGLRASGEVTCWGLDRDGQSTPPPGSFTSITSGGYHSCGIRADGTAECWGAGSKPNEGMYNYGEDLPPEGETFLSISAGDDHTCGILFDGSPLCWGSNDFGQISPKG